MESVQDGQEFSIASSYELHPEFGLVSVEDNGGLRYIPDTDGYLFDVDNKKRIGVGKDYQRCVDKHNANLHAHINGKPESKSKDIEDLPVDSEE